MLQPSKQQSGTSNSCRRRQANNSNVIMGAFLLVFGLVMLLKNMGYLIPSWLFRWEAILIFIGLYIGVRRNFHGAAWFILMAIGGISLLDELIPAFRHPQFTWSIVLIIVGLYFILRPNRSKWNRLGRYTDDSRDDDFIASTASTTNYDNIETLEVVSVFGGVKRVVLSKNFKGGDVVSVLGGADINLSQADINGRVRLDATNILGGTKLIIPPTWEVHSQIVSIFGGVEDKRDVMTLNIDSQKVLLLEGVCIFGGIEISNY